jgi:hypothetical protein
MTISAVSSSSTYYPLTTSMTSQKQSTFQAMQQLAQALQSGNVQGAQSAFSLLQTTLPPSLGGTASATGSASTASTSATSAVTPTGATGTTSGSTNPLATDMQTLSQALQSGNLSAAQTAFAQLQQDASQAAQSASGHHHHHHHHGGGSSSSSSSASSSSTSGTTSGATTSTTSGTSGLNVQA